MSESNANLVVTAPLALVTDDEGAVHYLYEGTSVPSYVQGAQRTRLVEDGLLGDKPAEGEDEGDKPRSTTRKSK